jgi:DNA polymerase/3'-5' exonuclease PolX
MAFAPTVFAANERIAHAFRRTAELLEHQRGDAHRIRAYRRGAQALRDFPENVEDFLKREGERGLTDLPDIGRGLSAAAVEILTTGRYRLLDRLEGEVSPEDLFARVPGIGEELAQRIHDELHIGTLEDGHEHQCTVVTETRGLDIGERVVRGRERACRTYYARRPRRPMRFAVPSFD